MSALGTPGALALLAGTVSAGLTAGLLTGFASAVMPGLEEADDESFVDVFVGVNRRIRNPVTAAYLGGGLVFPAAALALGGGRAPGEVTAWTVAGVGLHLATLGITRAVHVPLNDAVEAEGHRPGSAAATRLRQAFEPRWVPWNRVRAATATGAAACLAWALHVGQG